MTEFDEIAVGVAQVDALHRTAAAVTRDGGQAQCSHLLPGAPASPARYPGPRQGRSPSCRAADDAPPAGTPPVSGGY